MNVSLIESTERHLRVQVVEDVLDLADTTVLLEPSDFVLPCLLHNVDVLRVEIVEALNGPDSAPAESDEGRRGKGVLSATLVEVRFVIVGKVVHKRMRQRAVVRSDNAWASGTLAGRWWEFLLACEAGVVHGAYTRIRTLPKASKDATYR